MNQIAHLRLIKSGQLINLINSVYCVCLFKTTVGMVYAHHHPSDSAIYDGGLLTLKAH